MYWIKISLKPQTQNNKKKIRNYTLTDTKTKSFPSIERSLPYLNRVKIINFL